MTSSNILANGGCFSRSVFAIVFLALCNSTAAFADFNKSIENALKFGQKDGRYG